MPVSATTVTQYFSAIFRRTPSLGEAVVYQSMVNDEEALQVMLSSANDTVSPIIRLYQAAFNRLPDTEGMTAWVIPFAANVINLQYIADGFTQSTEFTSRYPATLSNSQFVGKLYVNILQRPGEDGGITGWTNALNSGAMTRAEVLLAFSISSEFKNNVQSQIAGFLSNIANTPVTGQGATSLYSGSLYDVLGKSVSVSTTFVLTPNLDVVGATYTGAEGTVTGVPSTTTLNVFDQISMKPNQTGNFVTASFLNNDINTIDGSVLPLLNNVQILNFKALNLSGGNTMNAGVAPSMTTFNMADPQTAGVLTINNVAATVSTIGLSEVANKNFPNGIGLVLNYAAGALTGARDSATLNLSNVNAVTNAIGNSPNVTLAGGSAGAGFETLNIVVDSASATGALNLVDSQGASTLSTLTLAGRGSYINYAPLKFGSAIAKIDASQLLGGATLTVGRLNLDYVGSSGNDRLNFAAAGDFTAADRINFGNGTNTLGLADTILSDELCLLIARSGAQRVAFTAGITANMAMIQPTTVVVDNNIAGNTFTRLADTDYVEVSTAAAGQTTIDLTATLGFHTANVNLAGTLSSNVQVASLTLTGQSEINLQSVGISGLANVINAVTLSPNSELNISGLGTGLILGALSAGASVDATSFSGALTVTGANAVSSFTGGSGNDTFNLGSLAGGDTVSGGSGNDIINSAPGQNGTSAIVISGGAGADRMNLASSAGNQTSVAVLNTAASDSYATSGQFDSVTFLAAPSGHNWSVALFTGINAPSLAASTNVQVGVTGAAVGGFIWASAAGTTAASNANASLYQDSNKNGIIDASDLRVDFIVSGNDTIAVSLVGGKAIIDMVGV